MSAVEGSPRATAPSTRSDSASPAPRPPKRGLTVSRPALLRQYVEIGLREFGAAVIGLGRRGEAAGHIVEHGLRHRTRRRIVMGKGEVGGRVGGHQACTFS